MKYMVYELIRETELVSDDIAGDIADALCMAYDSGELMITINEVQYRKFTKFMEEWTRGYQNNGGYPIEVADMVDDILQILKINRKEK